MPPMSGSSLVLPLHVLTIPNTDKSTGTTSRAPASVPTKSNPINPKMNEITPTTAETAAYAIKRISP